MKVDAGMAAVPSRFINLRKSIPVILPQVDNLFVHINNFTGDIPEILEHGKITVTISEKNRNAVMKMYAMPESDADYFFTMDDDILYPSDYVEKMVRAAEKFDGYSLICVHGSIFNPLKRIKNFIKKRKMFSFWEPVKKTRMVMMVGNGTCCYPARAFLTESNFKEAVEKAWNMDDVFIMCYAHRNEFMIHTVKRKRGWLKQLSPRGSSLQHKRPVKRMDELATEHKKHIIRAYRKIQNAD